MTAPLFAQAPRVQADPTMHGMPVICFGLTVPLGGGQPIDRLDVDLLQARARHNPFSQICG